MLDLMIIVVAGAVVALWAIQELQFYFVSLEMRLDEIAQKLDQLHPEPQAQDDENK